MSTQIEESWRIALKEDFESDYFKKLKEFLKKEKEDQTIFPPGSLIFNAYNLCPLPKVKVVIIGQDPYHGLGQAHGLCFSVPKGIDIPPSLKNIYKELNSDLGIPIPNHGNLEKWANQGVLLLNAILTVRAHQAASHHKQGWETFTDKTIKTISELRAGIVFLLWGNYAIKKKELIDTNKHFVLTSVHPSPLSASRGFLGCKHFSKTNQILRENSLGEIDWDVSKP